MGHQIKKGIVGFGQMRMHRVHHLLRRMRPRDGQDTGVRFANQVATAIGLFGAQTTCDDHFAIDVQGFRDGV